MAKKTGRKQENDRANEALLLVAKATVQVMEQYMTSPWLPAMLVQKHQWHTLFIRTIEAASSIARRNICPELFNAYLILGSRWFSHHESVEKILAIGRYGDCMVLLRSLLEDTDLMTYFAYYPEDAAEWRERLGREPVWSDKVYREGIQKFRMSRIWEGLRDKGIEPLGERDYPILSATVHASPWGARYYGRTMPGDPDYLHLGLAPEYDIAAILSAGLVLKGIYPRPIHAFLTSCASSRAPKSQWRSIEAKYNSLIEDWEANMNLDSWIRSEMDGAQVRISRGEEPEAVIEDVHKRFEERYGEALNAKGSGSLSNDVTA